MAKYMHKMTGSIDDRTGWIASYTSEELEERGLTAEEAFSADVGKTLFELAEKSPAAVLGAKGGSVCSLAKSAAAKARNAARKAAGKPEGGRPRSKGSFPEELD